MAQPRDDRAAKRASDADKRESGEPGGGQGRRDEVGGSGVYPPTGDAVPPDARVRMAGSWGGGDYNESGGSDLVYKDGQVLGGLSAGPDGKPTIDTHRNVVRPRLPKQSSGDEPKR